MNKVFYFDVETTGVNPAVHDIIQLAGYIEVDGEIKAEMNFKARPFDFENINPQALEVNGVTVEQLKEYPDARDMHKRIKEIFDIFVDRYDKNDKLKIAGYNVNFDIWFLSNFFEKCNDTYLFTYLDGRAVIDPYPVIQFMRAHGLIDTPDIKLETVCKYYGIELENAHDALADIEATKKLSEYLLNKYFKSNE